MKIKLNLDRVFDRMQTTQPIKIPDGSITPRTTTAKVECKIENVAELKSDLNGQLEQKCKALLIGLQEKLSPVAETANDLGKILGEYRNIDSLKNAMDTLNKQKDNAEAQVTLLTNDIRQITDGIKREMGSNYPDRECIAFETIYQEGIAEAKQLDNKLPAVLHYGININSVEDLVGAFLSKEDVHPIEVSLFQKAREYLDGVIDGQSYLKRGDLDLYPNNAVLLDIFVRDVNCIKRDENTKLPETHTIVLWKKKPNEWFLIDPSQKSYSEKFLDLMKKYGFDYLKLPTQDKLYGTADYAKGNKPKYSDDPNNPSPRDCIDIAVKVAFELNEQQKSNTILEAIEKNMYAQIGNSGKGSPNLVKLNNAIIRELQSSNLYTRTATRAVTDKINDELRTGVLSKVDFSTIRNYQDVLKMTEILDMLSPYIKA